MEKVQSFKFQNPEYGDIYTDQIQKNGKGWIGWIQEYPRVKCEERTKAALLKTLENRLYETLETDWEAWDRQLEEDVKAGKLDQLAEEALEDLRSGRCTELSISPSKPHALAWGCRRRMGLSLKINLTFSPNCSIILLTLWTPL